MIERTFAMVKPDAVIAGHFGHVLTRVEQEGFQVAELKLRTFTPGEVDAFYAEHVGREFYPAMREFMVSGPAALMVLEREDAVAHWRKVIGPTDPKKAIRLHQEQTEAWEREHRADVDEYFRIGGVIPPTPPEATLRAHFGDLREDAPMFRNAVHGSDNPASAAREIGLIFGTSSGVCGARSWRGRTCTEPSHEGPFHRAEDGTRWRGDSRESAGGAVLPVDVRYGFLGLFEDPVISIEEFSKLQGALFDVLAGYCGMTWIVPDDRQVALDAAHQRTWCGTFSTLWEELDHGRAKFSGNRLLLAALVEEVGEVAERLAAGDREGAAREAIQVASVAVRIAEEGDATVYPLDGFVELVHVLGEVARHSLQRDLGARASNLLHLSAGARRIGVNGDSTFSDMTDAEALP